jgi:ribosomal protein L7/L12
LVEPEQFVKSSLDEGESLDSIARSLIEDQHLGPIAAVKALRSGAGVSLAESKELVHKTLPSEQQEAAVRLWDEAIDSLDLDT